MYGGAECLVLTPDKRGDADRPEGNNPSNRLKQNVVCSSSVCLTGWHCEAGAGGSWSKGTALQCDVQWTVKS